MVPKSSPNLKYLLEWLANLIEKSSDLIPQSSMVGWVQERAFWRTFSWPWQGFWSQKQSCRRYWIPRIVEWFFKYKRYCYLIWYRSNKNTPSKVILFHTYIYSEQQKYTSSWFWNVFFSRISPEPLELHKSYLHLFTSLFEELTDETRILKQAVSYER